MKYYDKVIVIDWFYKWMEWELVSEIEWGLFEPREYKVLFNNWETRRIKSYNLELLPPNKVK